MKLNISEWATTNALKKSNNITSNILKEMVDHFGFASYHSTFDDEPAIHKDYSESGIKVIIIDTGKELCAYYFNLKNEPLNIQEDEPIDTLCQQFDYDTTRMIWNIEKVAIKY